MNCWYAGWFQFLLHWACLGARIWGLQGLGCEDVAWNLWSVFRTRVLPARQAELRLLRSYPFCLGLGLEARGWKGSNL